MRVEEIHGECIPGEKIRDLGQSVDLVKGTEKENPTRNWMVLGR